LYTSSALLITFTTGSIPGIRNGMAGFSQTTYPPLPQQWVALGVSCPWTGHGLYGCSVCRHPASCASGVYRFSLLWVSARAASIAALASVFLGSESFLVYSAGQLATTCAAPIYLNAAAIPLRVGSGTASGDRFLKSECAFYGCCCRTPCTLLFGSIFFAVPVLALVFFDRQDGERVSASGLYWPHRHHRRGSGCGIAVVLLPFWIALIHIPSTQVPIPHPSRANYLLRSAVGPQLLHRPYGALILALPFIFIRGSMVARLRHLAARFWVAFMVDSWDNPRRPSAAGRARSTC